QLQGLAELALLGGVLEMCRPLGIGARASGDGRVSSAGHVALATRPEEDREAEQANTNEDKGRDAEKNEAIRFHGSLAPREACAAVGATHPSGTVFDWRLGIALCHLGRTLPNVLWHLALGLGEWPAVGPLPLLQAAFLDAPIGVANRGDAGGRI